MRSHRQLPPRGLANALSPRPHPGIKSDADGSRKATTRSRSTNEDTWNHDCPYYRCRVHRDDPRVRPDHPATINDCGDRIVPRLDSWVAELSSDEHFDDTCAELADAAQPDTDQEAHQRQIRERLRKIDQELNSYRTIVRTEPEAASTVGKWIAETNQERRRLEALLGKTPSTSARRFGHSNRTAEPSQVGRTHVSPHLLDVGEALFLGPRQARVTPRLRGRLIDRDDRVFAILADHHFEIAPVDSLRHGTPPH